MLNRLMRYVVFISCTLLFIPSIVLTPISYIFFNYNLAGAIIVLGVNSFDQDDWNYKYIFDAIK